MCEWQTVTEASSSCSDVRGIRGKITVTGHLGDPAAPQDLSQETQSLWEHVEVSEGQQSEALADEGVGWRPAVAVSSLPI